MRTTNPFILAALMLSVVLSTSCGDKTPPETSLKATSRYETVPYVGTASRAGDSKIANLVFSEYDGDYNYYFFVLGHIKSAPLAYRPAIYYNGTTPVTVGYSASNVTETSISNSVTEANQHSVSKSTSSEITNMMGVTVGVEGGPPFVKFKMEATYQHTWSSTEESGSTTTRSTSNTYETSKATASEITDEISVTIGNSGEPAGLYRFSLFTTTDVYFVVVTDRAKTKIVSAEIAYCARPLQFWVLDYEPQQGGTFGKTASGSLLQIPDITVADLPDIEECEHEWGQWIMSLPATAKTEGEEARTCRLCERTETRVVPVLRTGTFNLNTKTWESGSGNGKVVYTISDNCLTVNDQAQIIVTSTSVVNARIKVNGNAFITLKDANIDGGGMRHPTIELNAGANLTLRLEGNNEIKGWSSYAAIQTTGATLTITGPGSLTATGGSSNEISGGGAGIGGSGVDDNWAAEGMAGGTVIIESGTVTAQGGEAFYGGVGSLRPNHSGAGAGAGIGGAGGGGMYRVGEYNIPIGGKGGAGGNITIHYGSTVVANGGKAGDGQWGGRQGASYGGGGGGGNGKDGDPAVIDDRR